MSKKYELDRDALCKHIEAVWKKKWDARFDQPNDVARELGISDPVGTRRVRKLFGDVYMKGAVDMLETVLEFEGDVRGGEAIAALLASFKGGEG